MSSIFTKIIRKEIPAHIVAETEDCIAFLDVNPNAAGHTLCVPKKEVDKITELSEADYMSLMRFSMRVAKAVEVAVSCKRVGFTVIGLEVPHVHVHLIPLNSMADATFGKKESLSQEEFSQLATQIAAAYNTI
ncbi:MAG: HIT family protein [Flavobacteriaceae bacterium]|jgi:histidine triad (HIT) family protein|nr:HIT family protein [Flavobacteriaceae bacterium LSUCC0859]MCI4641996.1 HIT family protein [Flavobacteriaceae bacterium]MCI5088046.1 HIT family protein [Flavobacteriaceae bacterium]CAI8182634.1 MAG: putative HIT-like protein [SAR116 cluster bacterium]